jgi:hypothetical protein
MSSPIARVLADLAAALGDHGCPWYVFGAQAAIVHGIARLTADVDVTIVCQHDDRRALVDRLASAGISLRVADVDHFVALTRVLPFVHTASGLPIDLVLGGPGLEEEFARRAQRHRIGDVDVPVARIEDLIVGKIIAGRTKDLDDVKAMLLANPGRVDRREVLATLRVVTDALGEADLVARFEHVLAEIALLA